MSLNDQFIRVATPKNQESVFENVPDLETYNFVIKKDALAMRVDNGARMHRSLSPRDLVPSGSFIGRRCNVHMRT